MPENERRTPFSLVSHPSPYHRSDAPTCFLDKPLRIVRRSPTLQSSVNSLPWPVLLCPVCLFVAETPGNWKPLRPRPSPAPCPLHDSRAFACLAGSVFLCLVCLFVAVFLGSNAARSVSPWRAPC